MRKTLIACLLFTTYCLLITSVHAQTPASQSADQIRNAVQQQVQTQLNNLKQNVSKKSFVGTLTAKTETGFTMTNLKSQTRTVTVTGDTTIKLLSGKEGTLADLKANDFLLAMGQADAQNKMTAKRIVVVAPSETDKRQVLWVTVGKTASTSLTVTDSASKEWTVKVSSTTDYTKVTDGKVAKAKLADVTAGAKLAIVATPAVAANTLTGLDIHISAEK